MTTQNDGADPVAVLYHRFTQDIFTLRASLRCDRMILPAFPAERGPKAKECWELFESYLESYRLSFERLNESARLHRELLQQTQVKKLVFRTRAKQGRQPFIEDAIHYVHKAKMLYLRWIEKLTPVEGKRTVKAFLAKVDHCQALWVEYGFTYEEIERLPALLDNLQNEWALIDVDREPNYSANPPPPTREQTKVAEPKKPSQNAGRPKADWTQEDKKIIDLSQQGMKPQEIASKLGLSNLATTKRIRALKRRIKDGNAPK